jgi:dolichol-phosphate mannosyltransferase
LSHDDLLVVLPTYNEAANLEGLVRELAALYPGVRLLVIDDSSPDGTGAIADRLQAEVRGVEVVHRPGKLGLGGAHILGLERALELGCRFAVTMDCDHTHRPQDLKLLIEALEREQADLAIGSRYLDAASMHDWPLPRRVITRTAHLFTRHLLGIPGDATSGFRLYRSSALARVPFRQVPGSGYSFIFELLFVCLERGLRVVEVPVLTPIRQSGESKISRFEVVRALKTLARLAWRRLRGFRKPQPPLC